MKGICVKRLILVITLLVSSTAIWTAQAHGEDKSVTIQFAAHNGDTPVACDTTYDDLGSEPAEVEVMDFRFYLSNIRLITSEGEEVALALTQDELWQYEDVVLLDFEDGTGRCADAGNDALNDKIIGTIHEGDYIGIAFTVGLPFELNHLDTTTAPSPLNIPAMWWNWQFGYKFIRVDLMAGQTPWFIHLGSTACEAEDGNTPPAEPCANANLMEVRFEDFNVDENTIVADLAGLVAGINLNESMPEPPGCMSGPDDPDCEVLFPNLGLELATGLCPEGECSEQTFFRIE
jgi:uncharacterized repeat protein (TIGR04052 family)